MKRRDFLRLTASVAAARALGACDSPAMDDGLVDAGAGADAAPDAPTPDAAQPIDFDPLAVPQNDAIFPSACMAGEMMPSSMVIAGFAADGGDKLLRVWQEGLLPGTVELVAEHEVTPDAAGYMQTAVSGLMPGASYRYGYFSPAMGAGRAGEFASRSLIGTVRTALADGMVAPLTVAISACNGGYVDPAAPPAAPFRYPALEVTAQNDYDMFLHLGDAAYMDRVFAAGGSKAQYLDAWRYYLGSEGMRRCYAKAGLYATWDDHEITDNSAVDPWSMDERDIERIDNGREAYFRAMPIAPLPDPFQLWRSFRWGMTAEIIILDCRYERNPPITGEYLSRPQMDFLKQRLADSPCQFKVVANSVPITDMPFYFDIVRNDRWEGYRAARTELLEHINNRGIENAWFLSGDLHVNFVSRVGTSDSLADRCREIAVTGGNLGVGAYGSNFEYSQTAPRGCLLTFDPLSDTVRVRFLKPDGSLDYDQILAGVRL